MTDPVVSVIVPVYNTMPYLNTCLDSLVNQSLGIDRLQVVAVDDGSTDGGSEVIDEYARRYPDSFVVVHQPNSGSPAGPCNRGLGLATGQYVFFIGADDHLGGEALERLVRAATLWDSDVIFGRMVGVGGRFVDQRVFAASRRQIGFIGSYLPYSLSNTKLFRRSLVEENHIRYALDLRVSSDQPFTVAALLKSRRTSVLSGYDFYYAVRRTDGSNISYSNDWRTKLSDVTAIIDHLAELIEPGEVRDALLHRHFVWEMSKLLRNDLPGLDEIEQRALLRGVGAVADRYLTVGVSRLLSPKLRVLVRLAQNGDLGTLLEVLAYKPQEDATPMVLSEDRVFDWAPGFDQASIHNDWYEVLTEDLTKRLTDRIALNRVAQVGNHLVLAGRAGLSADSARLAGVAFERLAETEPTPGARRYPRSAAPDEEAARFAIDLDQPSPSTWSRLGAQVDVRQVFGSGAPPAARCVLRLRVDAGSWTYDLPLRMADQELALSITRLGEPCTITLRSEHTDDLVLRISRSLLRADAKRSEQRPESEDRQTAGHR